MPDDPSNGREPALSGAINNLWIVTSARQHFGDDDDPPVPGAQRMRRVVTQRRRPQPDFDVRPNFKDRLWRQGGFNHRTVDGVELRDFEKEVWVLPIPDLQALLALDLGRGIVVRKPGVLGLPQVEVFGVDDGREAEPDYERYERGF